MAEAKKKTTKKAATAKEKPAVVKKPAKVVKKVEKKVEAAAPAPVEIKAPVVVEKKIFAKPAKPKPALPAGLRYYGTGRRKEAVAKVWLVKGSGKMQFNGKTLQEYFCNRRVLEATINRPFETVKLAGMYDVFAQLHGGGVAAQADAVRLGIARALVEISPDMKPALKNIGLMTRDPRMKERKKYGLKRARRAFQYTKR